MVPAMAFIVGVILVGSIVYLTYGYIFDRNKRSQINREVQDAPVIAIFSLIGTLAAVGFFLSIIIPPFGLNRVGYGDFVLPLSGACGITAVIWVFSIGIVVGVKEHREEVARRRARRHAVSA